MKSTRRLSIEKRGDETVIRYQWCPTYARHTMVAFLILAVTILIVDHAGHSHSLRSYVEMVWAAMALSFILVLAVNSTELRVTPEEVRIRCIPVALYSMGTLRRSDIVSVHHWQFWRKRIHHKLSIQLAFTVNLGTFDTADETRIAAEAIAERLQADCLSTPPNRKLDRVFLGVVLRIAAYMAAPLLIAILLSFFETS